MILKVSVENEIAYSFQFENTAFFRAWPLVAASSLTRGQMNDLMRLQLHCLWQRHNSSPFHLVVVEVS